MRKKVDAKNKKRIVKIKAGTSLEGLREGDVIIYNGMGELVVIVGGTRDIRTLRRTCPQYGYGIETTLRRFDDYVLDLGLFKDVVSITCYGKDDYEIYKKFDLELKEAGL